MLWAKQTKARACHLLSYTLQLKVCRIEMLRSCQPSNHHYLFFLVHRMCQNFFLLFAFCHFFFFCERLPGCFLFFCQPAVLRLCPPVLAAARGWFDLHCRMQMSSLFCNADGIIHAHPSLSYRSDQLLYTFPH